MKTWRLQKISSTGKLYCLWDTYFFKSSYLFQLNISEWKLITKALVISIDHCPMCNKFFATRLFQVYLPLRKCYYLNNYLFTAILWLDISVTSKHVVYGTIGQFSPESLSHTGFLWLKKKWNSLRAGLNSYYKVYGVARKGRNG